MHIVIDTQYMENYGDSQAPHWKAKGGSTYVVTDITVADAMSLSARPSRTLTPIPTLLQKLYALVEYSNEMSEEYVVNWELRDGEFQADSESWETPIFIRREGDKFIASETVKNNDWQFREEIAEKRSTWTMLPESDRTDYQVEYTMRDGRVVDEDGLIQILKMAS